MIHWLSNLKVSTRLQLAFGAMVVLLAVSLGAAWLQMRSQDAETQRLLDENVRKLQLIDRWVALSESTALQILAVNSTTDGALGALFGPEIGPRVKAVGDLFKQVDAVSTTPEERVEMEALVPKRKSLLATLAKLNELRGQGNTDAAASLSKAEFAPIVEAYVAHLKRYAELQSTLLNQAVEASRAEGRRRALVVAGLMALGLLGVSIAVIMIIGRLKRTFAQALDLAQQVAGGDLTARSEIDGGDELATLIRALNGMAGSLETLVVGVRQGTASIAVASSEIAQGNADLSVRTEQQSSNLQLAASAMEQMTSTVAQTTENARQADAMAREASDVAVSGGRAVQEVVATMAQIQTASRRIAEIVGVIDGIAFQTNILALNAAVEAARAGEQGRGFAVVAAEVRTLAGRSAEAAREIKSLIADSSEKVDAGHVQVGAAGQRMDEIVSSVRRVSQLIAEISTASGEQNDGIAEVGRSVSEIERATQQNAALVEQAAAAADSMNSQAQRLEEAVSVFRVGAVA